MAIPETPGTSDTLTDDQFRAAVTLLRSGQLDEAARILHGILARTPSHVGCLRLLGGLEVLRGKNLRLAEQLLRAAIAAHPGEAEAHNNLGMALVAQGRAKEAVPCYRKAVELRPRYAAALNNLGNALAGLDKPEEAIPCFREALAIQPDFPLARTNLGSALAAVNRYDEAIVAHQQALAAQENNAAIHLSLATTLQAAGREQEALPHFTRARDMRPQSAAVHIRLGTALQEVGRMDEARQCFEQAVALEPKRPAHYLNLTGSMRMQAGDPCIAAMEALAREEASLPSVERPTIHFALAKALADTGAHERAFQHLLRGNALKRAQVEYDEAGLLTRFRRIEQVITAEMLHRGRGKGIPSRQPVFILGMPRSGSTLVEQVLASHPDAFAAGEITAFRDAAREVGADGGDPAYPDAVPALSAGDFRRLAIAYLRQIRALARRDPDRPEWTPARIVNKLPSNFLYVGLIHLVFPNASIIHTCRDTIDTCLSCFAIDFVRQPFAFDLGELGRYWRGYAALMAHWHKVLPPGTILDVHYESVVANFEQEARRIIAHCGLPWNDACLNFQQAPRPVRTASVVQVRQPLYRSSVHRWRPDDDTLAPLLAGLEMARA